MNCSVCGKKVKDGASSCPSCGARISSESGKKAANKGNNVKVKKKNSLTTMDYITIGFTCVIVLVMVLVVMRTIKPEWFSSSGGGSSATSTATNGADATAAATATPKLTDVGNNYGNMTTNALVREINGRTYFSTVDSNGISGIYVEYEGSVRKLIEDNASYLNVITDPFTYDDVSGVVAYTIFYIDADGNICYITDGPVNKPSTTTSTATATASDATPTAVPTERPDVTVTDKAVLREGDFKSIAVSGDVMYFIDGDGHVGKLGLLENTYTVLSTDSYSSFAVYFGSIYALHDGDNTIYELSTILRTTPAPSSASPEATPTPVPEVTPTPFPGVDAYEQRIIDAAVDSFCIDSEWIYTSSDDGIVRYLTDGSGKDTLSDIKADFVTALGDAIYYVTDGKLYASSARGLLTGSSVLIGEVASDSLISVTPSGVYIYYISEHHMLRSLINEDGSYSELSNVLDFS